MQACQALAVDIIKVDPKETNFVIGVENFQRAAKRGIFLELLYAPVLRQNELTTRAVAFGAIQRKSGIIDSVKPQCQQLCLQVSRGSVRYSYIG